MSTDLGGDPGAARLPGDHEHDGHRCSEQIRTEVVEGDCVMEAKVEARPVIQVQAPVPEPAETPADGSSSTTLKMTARDVMRVLRREAGVVRRLSRHSRPLGDRLDRAVRLRQVDLPALLEPDERHHRGVPRHRQDRARRREYLFFAGRPRAAPGAGRHGLSEAESVPQIHLRERRLRPAYPWLGQARRPTSTRSWSTA